MVREEVGSSITSYLATPSGARMGTSTGTTAHWLLYDLLGSVVASQAAGSGTTSLVDALRYDAYGQTLGQYPTAGSDLGPRFRGLLDLAPTADRDVTGPGADPLYQMGARAYAPHLGTFTKLDTYAGRAQEPISLNRYLYAHANPATLIDPSGHCTTARSCPDGGQQTPDPEPVCSSSACKDTTPTGGGNTGGGGGGGGTSSTGNSSSGGAVPPPTVTFIPFNQLPQWKHQCGGGGRGAPQGCAWKYVLPTDYSGLVLAGCSALPIVGTGCDAEDLRRSVEAGDWVGTGLAGIGFVWGLGDGIKLIGKGINGTFDFIIRSATGADAAVVDAARKALRGVDSPPTVTRGGLKAREYREAQAWAPIMGGELVGLPKIRGSVGDAADLLHNGRAVSLKNLKGNDQTFIGEMLDARKDLTSGNRTHRPDIDGWITTPGRSSADVLTLVSKPFDYGSGGTILETVQPGGFEALYFLADDGIVVLTR